MPGQKRHRESASPPPSPSPSPSPSLRREEGEADDSVRDSENLDQERLEGACDSDRSSYASGEENEEFIIVKLADIRREVQCPICLGIIKKTRTVMECLHRFCRECIDKSMRLGNNECPACRTHCASRRSLRDDPNYDALISALYPNIDKYEEEELAFHADEKFRNNQIQASIAQTYRRQAEALGKKRTTTRATSTSRRQGNHRNLRGRRSHHSEYHESDEEEGANGHDGSNDLSSVDEHVAEVKSKRCKQTGGGLTSQPSLGINSDGVCDDDYSEENGEQLGASATLIGGIEFLAWGRGGLRSNNRYGGHGWACDRLLRNDRLSCLTNHLQHSRHSLESNEMKICLMLVTLQEEKIPSLKRPYICCSPTSSVRQLCQYVSMQTSVEAGEIEMLMIPDDHPIDKLAVLRDGSAILHPFDSKLHVLNAHQTLEEIHARYTQKNLILAYRLKAQGEGK